jgi:hypothetical protein
MSTIYLDAAIAIVDRGLLINAETRSWESDQNGPADVKRQQVLSIPYPTFGKLTLADRLAFSAANLLFSRYPDCTGEKVGITMGVPCGSLSTDLRYQETIATIPSPALFSATLPSSPVSEIAIHYKLKGPNRVFAQARAAGLYALHSAFRLLQLGKAETVIALMVSGLEARDSSTPFAAGVVDTTPAAYAFLVTANKRPGALNYHGSFALKASAKRRTQGSERSVLDSIFSSITQSRDIELDFDVANCSGTLLLTKDG